MMPAALLAGAARAQFSSQVLLATLLLATVTIATGGILHKRIRKSSALQLGASTSLGLLVAPAQLMEGASLATIALDVLAWASLFTACSLAVRACFARASKRAAIFTCSTEVVSDFARQCERLREYIECDLLYNRIAHEIWDKRPGAAADIADALADFAAERKRHLESIDKLSTRFAALAGDDSFHEHLDPVEKHQELVEMRLSEISQTNALDLPA